MSPEQREQDIEHCERVIRVALGGGMGYYGAALSIIDGEVTAQAERRGAEKALRDAEAVIGQWAKERLIAHGPEDPAGIQFWDVADWLHTRANRIAQGRQPENVARRIAQGHQSDYLLDGSPEAVAVVRKARGLPPIAQDQP